MDIKDIISRNKEITALITIYIALQAVILSLVWSKPLSWDPAVYSAMAKHLYTFGELGFWENFRPPLIPIILGIAYFIDSSMIGYPRLLMIAISTIGVATTYIIAKKEFTKETALYAAGIIASAQIYFFQSTRINAELTGSILVLASIYLIGKRNTLSGALTAVAFLARFPAAIIGVASSLTVTKQGWSQRNYKKILKENLKLLAGFSTVAIIYFYLNYRYLGSFIEPLRSAILVPANNPETQLYGAYYFKELILTQPLLALIPIGVFIALKTDRKKHTPYVLSLIVLYALQEHFPHKEPRYALIFLPIAAIYSGIALEKIREKTQNKFQISQKHIQIIYAIIITIALFNTFYTTYNMNNWEAAEQRQFIQDIQELEANMVIGNHPSIAAHGQFKYQNIPMGHLEGVYSQNLDELDYIAIESCSWGITSEEHQQEVDQFNEKLEAQHNLTAEYSDDRCSYKIYQVK